MSGVGAWIRYGGPISPEQLDFAAQHYRAAILRPWETAAAADLKWRRPDMTVLCYKCLSSTRSYEPGPVHSYRGLVRRGPGPVVRATSGR